jgi:hypothetical protein
MTAAIALARFAPTPDLATALGRAVCDEQYLVRFHAANTLLRYARPRRPADVCEHRKLFDLIADPRDEAPAARDERARWQRAAEELCARALRRGSARTPRS